MPYVTFTADFDFEQQYGVTLAYKSGWSGVVTTACAEAAGDRCVIADQPETLRNGINEQIRRRSAKGTSRI